MPEYSKKRRNADKHKSFDAVKSIKAGAGRGGGEGWGCEAPMSENENEVWWKRQTCYTHGFLTLLQKVYYVFSLVEHMFVTRNVIREK